MQLIQIILFILIICQIVVSVLVIYIFKHFRRLSKDVSTGNLITVIDKLIDIEENNTESVSRVNKRLDEIEITSLDHIQKFGFVRFNPFQELGGEHSFSLALLNGKDNGFVITGLHSRDKTRVYSKEVVDGTTKIELSEEEKKVLKEALK